MSRQLHRLITADEVVDALNAIRRATTKAYSEVQYPGADWRHIVGIYLAEVARQVNNVSSVEGQ